MSESLFDKAWKKIEEWMENGEQQAREIEKTEVVHKLEKFYHLIDVGTDTTYCGQSTKESRDKKWVANEKLQRDLSPCPHCLKKVMDEDDYDRIILAYKE